MVESGIAEQDRWAFRKVAQMLSRIRMEDQGFGVVRIVLQNKEISSVEQQSVFRAEVGLTKTVP